MVSLAPELARCVLPAPRGKVGYVLDHPLLRLDGFDPKSADAVVDANVTWHYRHQRAERALWERDFTHYVLCYEPRYRFDALMRVVDRQMTFEYRRRLILALYIETEHFTPNLLDWKQLLKRHVGPNGWGEIPLPYIEPFSGKVTLYRGGRNKGIAWTLDPAVAHKYTTPAYSKYQGAGEFIWAVHNFHASKAYGYTAVEHEVTANCDKLPKVKVPWPLA